MGQVFDLSEPKRKQAGQRPVLLYYNRPMRARMRLNHWLLPLLLALSIVMQVIDPSRVWKILAVGLGGTWLFGWLWARDPALRRPAGDLYRQH